MNCALCNDELIMKYELKENGKLKGKYTCSCGHGLPKDVTKTENAFYPLLKMFDKYIKESKKTNG